GVGPEGVGAQLAVHGDGGLNGAQGATAELADVDGVVAVAGLDRDGAGRRFDAQGVVEVAEVDEHAGRRHRRGGEAHGVRPAAGGAGDAEDADRLGAVGEGVGAAAERHGEVVGDAGPGRVVQNAVDDLKGGGHPAVFEDLNT